MAEKKVMGIVEKLGVIKRLAYLLLCPLIYHGQYGIEVAAAEYYEGCHPGSKPGISFQNVSRLNGNSKYIRTFIAFFDDHHHLYPYASAKATCESWGMRVAQVSSLVDFQSLDRLLTGGKRSCPYGRAGITTFALAGSDETKEGHWVLPDGRPLSFQAFDYMEPTNSDVDAQQNVTANNLYLYCLSKENAFHGTQFGLAYRDFTASSGTHEFLCEFKPETPCWKNSDETKGNAAAVKDELVLLGETTTRQYYVSTAQKRWRDAQKLCNSRNYKLLDLEFPSEGEAQQVGKFMRRFVTDNELLAQTVSFWLSGSFSKLFTGDKVPFEFEWIDELWRTKSLPHQKFTKKGQMRLGNCMAIASIYWDEDEFSLSQAFCDLPHWVICYKGEDWTTPTTGVTYKPYNDLITCHASHEIAHPKNIAEVQALVHSAIASGQRVKGFGSLHSQTDVICTDGIPISMKNLSSISGGKGDTVTVGPGVEVRDLIIYLHERKRTLILVPIYGGITVGGSMGTGAHGSSLMHSSSMSDQVVSLKVIDGSGQLHTIDDPHELRAFRLHLGLLGLLVEVTLRVVPSFKMRAHNFLRPESILVDGTAQQLAQENDYVQFSWFPNSGNVVVISGVSLKDAKSAGEGVLNWLSDQTSEEIAGARRLFESLHASRDDEGLAELETKTESSLYQNESGLSPFYTEGVDRTTLKNPVVGFGWKLLSSRCTNKCGWDNGPNSIAFDNSAIAVNAHQLGAAVKKIKNILAQVPEATFPFQGIIIRFYKESDAFMSITGGNPSVVFEILGVMREKRYEEAKYGLAAYQAILQTLLKDFGGRPHWGKCGLYYQSREALRSSPLNFQPFIKVMKKYDPKGLFLNKFGERLLDLSDETDTDPQVTRCALQEFCVCSSEGDCAPGQNCSKINGHSVCRDEQQRKKEGRNNSPIKTPHHHLPLLSTSSNKLTIRPYY